MSIPIPRSNETSLASARTANTTGTNTGRGAGVGGGAKRICHGIEMLSSLVWQGHWQVGEAHTRVLQLKNLHMSAKKINFRYPKTNFFQTTYPKQIFLAPGANVKIPIVFTPTGKDAYNDRIDFECKDGEKFSVELVAIPPSACITMASEVDMGKCSLQMTVTKSVRITNSSAVPTRFIWSTAKPFSVVPQAGHLKAKESLSCTFSFSPTEALVFNLTAVCRFATNKMDTQFAGYTQVLLQGIGKNPKLTIDFGKLSGQTVNDVAGVRTMDFGRIAVGTETRQVFHLRNTTRVTSSFRLEWEIEKSCDSAGTFFISPDDCGGEIEPGGSRPVSVFCRPSRIGAAAHHTLNVSTMGSPEVQPIQCTAYAFGPCVRSSSTCIAFPSQATGQSQTTSFFLSNDSIVPAAFEITPNCQSVFRFSPVTGFIAANSKIPVSVTFAPMKAFCYNRLLTCLIHHQEPIFINVIGTGYTEQLTPVELLPTQLTDHHTRLLNGLAAMGPHTMRELVYDKKAKVEGATITLHDKNVPLHVKSQTVAKLSPFNFITQSQNTSYCLTGIDRNHVDFGGVTTGISEVEPLTLANTTEEVIIVQWIRDQQCPFLIQPESRSLEPGQRCCFRAQFEPGSASPAQLFNTTMECFCMYRAMLDHDKVKSPFECLSWSFPVTMTGHTFMFQDEICQATLSLSPVSLTLPCSIAHIPVHGSVVLSNSSSIAAQFSHERLPGSSCVSVWPANGTVEPFSHKVLTVKALSSESTGLEEKVSLKVNHHYRQDFSVIATTEQPDVTIDTVNRFCYFPSVTHGRTSERSLQVKNTSPVPLYFAWRLSSRDKANFSIEPETGYMKANETQAHELFFMPVSAERITATAIFEYWSGADGSAEQEENAVDGSDGSSSQMLVTSEPHQTSNPVHRKDITLVGSAVEPEIKVEVVVPLKNFVVVGTSSHHQVLVRNPTKGSIECRLVCSAPEHYKISVSPATVQLPPLTHVDCVVKLWPMKRGHSDIKVYAVILNDMGEPLTGQSPFEVCQLEIEAMYPRLTVTNVTATGSAEHISKARLWKMTGAPRLNALLKKTPTPVELLHDRITRQNIHLSNKARTPAAVDVDLGTAVSGSRSSVIYWRLENKKLVDCQWEMAFPDDLKLKLENWADEVLSVADAQLYHFLKSNTFTISPRKGCLLPGCSTLIRFKYEHHIIGENRMPVLLKIGQGREVALQLHGTTVPPLTPYMCWPSLTHTFQPVSVRCQTPPAQSFTLYNDGAASIPYAVDEKEIKHYLKVCAGHSPITCLNPQGVVPAGGSCDVDFVFSPREVANFKFELAITTGEGEEQEVKTVTFYGSSFDQPVTNMEEERQLGIAIGSDVINVPRKTIVTDIGQHAKLSTDLLSLAAFPTNCKTSQILWLCSTHLSHQQHCRWIIPKHLQGQLKVTPEEITLAAEESVVVEFSMVTPDVRVFEVNILCELTDVQRQVEYDKDFSNWLKSKVEETQHFTITERDIAAAKRNAKEQHHGNGSRGDGMSTERIDGSSKWPTGRTTIHRPAKKFSYNTLPDAVPVFDEPALDDYQIWKQTDLSERSTTRPRKQRSSKVGSPPIPPKATQLHLLLTGRSYAQQDFNDIFPEQATSFVPVGVPVLLTDPTRNTQFAKDVDSAAGCQATRHIMSSLLQDLLESQDFQDDISKIEDDPVPRYSQLIPRTTAALDTEVTSLGTTANGGDEKRPISAGSAKSDVAWHGDRLTGVPLAEALVGKGINSWDKSSQKPYKFQFSKSPVGIPIEDLDEGVFPLDVGLVTNNEENEVGAEQMTVAEQDVTFKETEAVSEPSSPRRLSYAMPLPRRQDKPEETKMVTVVRDDRAGEELKVLASWPGLTSFVNDIVHGMAKEMVVDEASVSAISSPGPG